MGLDGVAGVGNSLGIGEGEGDEGEVVGRDDAGVGTNFEVAGGEECGGGVEGGGVVGGRLVLGWLREEKEVGVVEGGEMGAGGGVEAGWAGLVAGGGVKAKVEVVALGGRGLAEDSPLPWDWLPGSCLSLKIGNSGLGWQ